MSAERFAKHIAATGAVDGEEQVWTGADSAGPRSGYRSNIRTLNLFGLGNSPISPRVIHVLLRFLL